MTPGLEIALIIVGFVVGFALGYGVRHLSPIVVVSPIVGVATHGGNGSSSPKSTVLASRTYDEPKTRWRLGSELSYRLATAEIMACELAGQVARNATCVTRAHPDLILRVTAACSRGPQEGGRGPGSCPGADQ
jgi:hypothetical protein